MQARVERYVHLLEVERDVLPDLGDRRLGLVAQATAGLAVERELHSRAAASRVR
jgi:hypothetical protein